MEGSVEYGVEWRGGTAVSGGSVRQEAGEQAGTEGQADHWADPQDLIQLWPPDLASVRPSLLLFASSRAGLLEAHQIFKSPHLHGPILGDLKESGTSPAQKKRKENSVLHFTRLRLKSP